VVTFVFSSPFFLLFASANYLMFSTFSHSALPFSPTDGGGNQETGGSVSIEGKDVREEGGQRNDERATDSRQTINDNRRRHRVRDKSYAAAFMYYYVGIYRTAGYAAQRPVPISDPLACADILWTPGERIELTNGGKIARRLSDSAGGKDDDWAVLFATTSVVDHPTFEIRLLSKSTDLSVPYFSIAVPGNPRPDWLLPYGVGLDHGKRIIFYDYSQGEEGIAMLRWPNKLTVTHLTDWPADRLRFSTHLQRGEFRLYAMRCASDPKVLSAVSNPSDLWQFVCHLSMKPELLVNARPVCMISAGCSVEIRAVDE
jgi:hypothetical protein